MRGGRSNVSECLIDESLAKDKARFLYASAQTFTHPSLRKNMLGMNETAFDAYLKNALA